MATLENAFEGGLHLLNDALERLNLSLGERVAGLSSKFRIQKSGRLIELGCTIPTASRVPRGI